LPPEQTAWIEITTKKERRHPMITRRSFLHFTSAALSANAFSWTSSGQDGTEKQQKGNPMTDRYPAYPPDLIQKIVRVSHFSLDNVKEIVGPHPQLVKAAWDWGFGDWETPLGAACHMGRKDIAEYLLSQGATPSLFSAVLFGDISFVKQVVEHQPGIQRVAGPHSISLLAHARVGGVAAKDVYAYLHSLGDADMASPTPVTEQEQKLICGTYQIGSDAQSVEVSNDMRPYANSPMYTYPPQLSWKRTGTMERPLFHVGGMKFYPAGAPSIQIRFEEKAHAAVMTVMDGGEVLSASRPLTA
jgi:hypothetical protein